MPCTLVVSDRNLGFAGGVDLAWQRATAELICLLNNDATVHPDALALLADALAADEHVSAVWPFDAPHDWSESLRVLSETERAALASGTHGVLGANVWAPLITGPEECFTASGVCLMLRRREWPLPFPPEYFAYYEDVLLGWRIRLRGNGIRRIPGAVIYHRGSATSAAEPALRLTLASHAERNRLTTVFACWSAATLARLAPLFALDELRRLLAAAAGLLAARPLGIRIWTRARLSLLGRLPGMWRLRAQVQGERRVNDSLILERVSYRLTMRDDPASRTFNAIARTYCRLVGLRTVEVASRTIAQARAVQV